MAIKPAHIWFAAVEQALAHSHGATVEDLGPCVHMLNVNGTIHVIAIFFLQFNLLNTWDMMREYLTKSIRNKDFLILMEGEQLFYTTDKQMVRSHKINGKFLGPPEEMDVSDARWDVEQGQFIANETSNSVCQRFLHELPALIQVTDRLGGWFAERWDLVKSARACNNNHDLLQLLKSIALQVKESINSTKMFSERIRNDKIIKQLRESYQALNITIDNDLVPDPQSGIAQFGLKNLASVLDHELSNEKQNGIFFSASSNQYYRIFTTVLGQQVITLDGDRVELNLEAEQLQQVHVHEEVSKCLAADTVEIAPLLQMLEIRSKEDIQVHIPILQISKSILEEKISSATKPTGTDRLKDALPSYTDAAHEWMNSGFLSINFAECLQHICKSRLFVNEFHLPLLTAAHLPIPYIGCDTIEKYEEYCTLFKGHIHAMITKSMRANVKRSDDLYTPMHIPQHSHTCHKVSPFLSYGPIVFSEIDSKVCNDSQSQYKLPQISELQKFFNEQITRVKIFPSDHDLAKKIILPFEHEEATDQLSAISALHNILLQSLFDPDEWSNGTNILLAMYKELTRNIPPQEGATAAANEKPGANEKPAADVKPTANNIQEQKPTSDNIQEQKPTSDNKPQQNMKQKAGEIYTAIKMKAAEVAKDVTKMTEGVVDNIHQSVVPSETSVSATPEAKKPTTPQAPNPTTPQAKKPTTSPAQKPTTPKASVIPDAASDVYNSLGTASDVSTTTGTASITATAEATVPPVPKPKKSKNKQKVPVPQPSPPKYNLRSRTTK